MQAVAAEKRIALKKILFATDFSPVAEEALPYAIALARQYGAKVHALHVRFPSTYPVVDPDTVPAVIEAAEEQAKFEAQQLHEMFRDVPHEVTVAEGDLWPILGEIVEKQNVDLIVVGTHGRKGFSRAVLGSAAEEIFRKAPCAVLTVGPRISHDTQRRLRMKEILFATDFSAESLAALPFAVSLAQEHESNLTLLNVTGPPEKGELVHPQEYAESKLRRLQGLVPADARVWCEPKCRVEHGQEAEKILEVATALGADLIVLGVRQPQGMGAATHLGHPVAHEVVANAACPVLTFRA